MPLVDVAVLAALGEELQTFRQVLRAEAKTVGTSQRGNVVADLFVLKTPAGDRTICVASDFAMGGENMASFATFVFSEWKPLAAVLTGIAGLVDVKSFALGDVAVADQVFSYANVAVTKGELLFRKSGFQVSAALRNAASRFIAEPDEYLKWQAAARAAINPLVETVNKTRPKRHQMSSPELDVPRIFVEPGAAGPFLVRDEKFRDEVVGKQVDEKVAWLEMEGHGFMRAAHQADVKAIVAKGISDLSDGKKSKLEAGTKGFWRLYAAANAASTVIEMLKRSTLPPLGTNLMSFALHPSDEFALRSGVFEKKTGFVNLGFPELIRGHGPLIDASVHMIARNSAGEVAKPTKFAATQRLLGRDAVRLHGTVQTDGGVAIDIPDSESPCIISFAVSFPKRVERIDFTTRALFRDALKATWAVPTRRPK